MLVQTFVYNTLTSVDRQTMGDLSMAKSMILFDFIYVLERGTRNTLRKCADFSKPGEAVSFFKKKRNTTKEPRRSTNLKRNVGGFNLKKSEILHFKESET